MTDKEKDPNDEVEQEESAPTLEFYLDSNGEVKQRKF